MMRTIPLILWKGFLLAISCLRFESEVFQSTPEGINELLNSSLAKVTSSKLKLETEHDALEKAFLKLNLYDITRWWFQSFFIFTPILRK